MIRDILDYLLSLIKSRIFPLALIFIVLFITLINRLFSLQIINGETTADSLTDSIEKKMTVSATRGRIYDRNGVLLAYNDLAFAVKISDSGTYTSNGTMKANEVKNMTINNSIEKTLQIIEEKGDSFTLDFQIEDNGDGNFAYNVSGNSLLRFKRDSYGTTDIASLSDEQKSSSANDMIAFFCNKYGLTQGDYATNHLLEIISLRINMSNNAYNRYISFTISNEVSDETVAAIMENSGTGELVGVTVEEQYIRRYVDSVYCSQILGYTGKISETQLEELKAKNDSYDNSDVVGKAGIEASMELELAGDKGTKTVYVDTVGRITEVLDETEASAGNDVYLTIDVNLQKKIYNAIEDELVSIILSHLSNGGSKYSYSSTGSVSDIAILINEAYFALIDNGMVSIKKIENPTTDTEHDVNNAFLSKQSQTMSWLQSELTGDPTIYGSLSDENKVYVWYVYSMLKTEGVFNTDNIDTNDEVYKEWVDGNGASIEDLLKQAIAKNWLDMSVLTTEQYTSLQESYDYLVQYIMDSLYSDTAFHEKMYKYMIESGAITGRQLCMLLYEQGTLVDDGAYSSLSSGGISAYSFIYNAISNKIITPGQLGLEPCSGSCVITDPNNGDVLALVSYPSYDNNKLSGTVDSEYYSLLQNSNAKPLTNWATQSRTAPGSTFKPCSAIAGLDTGVISTGTTFYCSGQFTEVTPSPKCWIYPGAHGSESVSTAIRDSCNVFFYTVGYKLALSKNGSFNNTYGTSLLQKYAEELGLATESGIEIEESTPHASNTEAIPSAIGQGNHAYSCLNLARYATTLATSGTCYNLTLVDKITDYDGNVVRDNSAEINNKVELAPSIWSAVHSGMEMAGATYSKLNELGLKIAAKSGTAQENTKEPDHSLLITYAPYDDPKVCTSVVLPNGYSSSTSMELTEVIYKIYYGIE